nr:hypothetical protein [uncultured Carboxylicivirga sp.]
MRIEFISFLCFLFLFASAEKEFDSHLINKYHEKIVLDSLNSVDQFIDNKVIDTLVIKSNPQSNVVLIDRCIIKNVRFESNDSTVLKIYNSKIDSILSKKSRIINHVYINRSDIKVIFIQGKKEKVHMSISESTIAHMSIDVGDIDLIISKSKFDNSSIVCNSGYLNVNIFENNELGRFFIRGAVDQPYANIKISDSNCKTLIVNNFNVENYQLIRTNIGKTHIKSCILFKTEVKQGSYPLISLNDVNVIDVLDLSTVKRKNASFPLYCIVIFNDTIWKKINSPHHNYYRQDSKYLETYNGNPGLLKASINFNKLLLKEYEKTNQAELIKSTDIWIKYLKARLNKNKYLFYLDFYWWECGYNKNRIPLNIFLIFILLVFINTMFLDYLNKNVYRLIIVEHLLYDDKKRRTLLENVSRKIIMSFIYTGYIFFGLKIDMDKLYIEALVNKWRVDLLLYFLFIYLIGFLFVAQLLKNFFEF